MLQTATDILDYLSSLYTEKGLWDPIEQSTLPNKYGNSFFALACGLLYQETEEKKWESLALKASIQELKNTKNRFHKIEMFRWEFKNYALLQLASKRVLPELRKGLRSRIKNMQDMGSFRANWMAMRGLNLLLRWELYQNAKDLKEAEKEIKKVLQRQTREGLFCDEANDNSFQYHAYILTILIQCYKILPSPRLRQRIIRGLDVLVLITDPEGNCSYFGRGQQQIFGYTSAIYALSFAHNHFDKKYGPYAKLIFHYIKPYLKEKNILANKDKKFKSGWYRYNYLTDYLPFAAVYLLLAHKELDLKKIKLSENKPYETFLESSNLFIKNTKEYFVCICAGNKSKSELPGLVHMYPKTIPCSGGPPVNMHGKDYSYNFLGIGEKNLLEKTTGKFLRQNDKLHLAFNLEKMKVIYTWTFGKDLLFNIAILPKEKITLSPLHYTSWKALDKTEAKGSILTPMGIAKEYSHKKIKINKPFSIKLKLYNGKTKPKKLISSYRKPTMLKKQKKQKINHFLKLGSRKLTKHPKDFVYSFFFLYTRNNYKRKKNLILNPREKQQK
tara:strand:- start:3518 stop:5188 length:1671 start_codon:yes stop_codon:yes gene_type:complete